MDDVLGCIGVVVGILSCFGTFMVFRLNSWSNMFVDCFYVVEFVGVGVWLLTWRRAPDWVSACLPDLK